ncbi:MFS transporter [Sphingomonas canadensis]|uniref:MFS transporter n=1 Tax=Sphingomonas canadensis TaxID=1219257 RepID=A0ABW3H992_9SPHN|nr:MFS transporter [Sphingomonas canadensis]MCW3836973.1 MFS transporter [Sphingomonas canadensis]
MTGTAVAVAMFMAQLDATVIHTALPAMGKSFGVAPVDLSIGVTVYLLAQAACLPASAWLTDRLGPKRVFALAVLCFTLSSLWCGLTHSLGQFVAARVAQGASAALMMPVGGSLLVRSAGKERLVQVMTLTSTAVLLAPTFGPAIGGFCVTYLSWPWAFLINVPIGVLGLVMIWRHVPDLPAENPRPFDTRGFLLGAAAMTGLLIGLDRVSSASGDIRIALACLAGGAAAALAAVRHFRRHPAPLLSLAPLRSDIYRISVLSAGAPIRIAIRALPFVLPLMFQLSLGMSAFAAGLTLIMLNGSDLVIKPLIRVLLRRLGYRANLLASCLASAAGTALCAAFSPSTPLWVILVCLMFLGAARSILFTGVQTLLYTDVPEDQTTSATVLWNVFQQLTSAIAVSLSAIIINALSALHGRWGEAPGLADFRVALLFHAALLLAAMASLRKLEGTAGARLSGHSAQT